MAHQCTHFDGIVTPPRADRCEGCGSTFNLGYISWLDIEILERDEHKGERVVGKARAAIIHAAVAGGSLYHAMDADSGELEALYSVYFEDGYFKEKFSEGSEATCST